MESYRAARQVTQKHAKSFYFSSFPLPKMKRLRAYALYAYCRYCDDWIDGAAPGSRKTAAEELKIFTRQLLECTGEHTVPPWAAAFRDTFLRCRIPERLCMDLIHGVCLDAAGTVNIPNWPALREYCYYVASVVGLMMNCVFEPSNVPQSEAAAISMGIAMQLTNVLRDVRQDAMMGRVYLPTDELEQYGLAGADFRAADVYKTSQWRRYAALFAERAREHYRAAEPGIELLPDDGSRYCVLCMSRIYAAILDKIRAARWDVSERRYVSFFEKIVIASSLRKSGKKA